jgi:CRISPR-associated endonuclease/helicase Cas3
MISFADFYDILTRPAGQGEPRTPFQWQKDLVDRVLALEPSDRWPEICALPTGTGKTSIAVVALYAMFAHRIAGRSAHRRIVYVVDRRIVADKTHDVLDKAAKRLRSDPRATAIARDMRQAFQLCHGDPVLDVLLWRGGLSQRLRDLRRPDIPTVIISTVDQAGSSLLFRGYGLREGMRSIRAGLLAYDTLWLVDEAHISMPLVETLRSVRKETRRASTNVGLVLPLDFVQLTATPRDPIHNEEAPRGVFSISVEAPDADIAERVKAKKPTIIEYVPFPKDLSKTIVASVHEALEDGRRRVGVVVNTVNLARTIFEQLRTALEPRTGRGRPAKMQQADARCILLTGAIRGFDREQLLRREEWSALQSEAAIPDYPVVAVCTQTIEVGADLDFDALVTQSAPLDVLIQRFGRLNRLGKRNDVARGVIIHPGVDPSEQGSRQDPKDPVYGETSSRTIRDVLGPMNSLDFGIVPLVKLFRTIEACSREQYLSKAPLFEPLLEPHIRRLVRTRPTPIDDPDVASFLHGNRTADSVRIVWRDNPECVNLMPPLAAEGIELHIGALTAFLKGLASKTELADVATDPGSELVERRDDEASVEAWLYDPNASTDSGAEAEIVTGNDIRPGDTIAVSTCDGGVDEFGWSPESKKKVTDLSTIAAGFSFGRNDCIDPQPTGRWRFLLPELKLRDGETQSDQDEESIDADRVREVLEEQLALSGNGAVAPLGAVLRRQCMKRILELPADDWKIRATTIGTLIFVREHIVSSDEDHDDVERVGEGAPETIDDLEDEATNFLSRTVSLEQHSTDVAKRALLYAKRCGLSDHLGKDVRQSGLLHDLGKGHPGFQRVLDPNGTADAGKELLAKGVRGPMRRLRRQSEAGPARWPSAARHEILSISMLNGVEAYDRELVEYLVASHHGWGRPFFPTNTPRGTAFEVLLDGKTYRFEPACATFVEDPGSGWIDRFNTMNGRYGPWGLAYLEAILRLADHRCSEDEESPEVAS